MLSPKRTTLNSILIPAALFVAVFAFPRHIFAANFGDACPGDICQTALGPVSIASDFDAIADLLGLIVGIGGAIAFLLMIYGVYILTTSAGIPDKVNQGKEIISSAVFGLLFIILSLIVFRIIGINILAIPGIT